jgi:N-acetylglucosaminyl-diphospho-decaprenol L-rhamnosyltransferase
MSVQLSIIFVNWNSSKYLQQCVASIYEHTRDVRFELIVVDNASPDEDADILTQQFKDLKLIKNPENIGFGRANNLGFKHSTGMYVLFLNPDTKLISPAIKVMLTQLEILEDVGILGCRLLNSDLSVQSSCIQRFPTILNQALNTDFLRQRLPQSRLWGTSPLLSNRGAPAKVEVISGACMMIKRDVFERIGMFSEEYFMYAEDLDLCRKATRTGYDNYFIGEAMIIHHGGKSSTPQSAIVMKWHSMLRYFVKNHGYNYALLFRGVMSVVALCRLGLIALGAAGRYTAGNNQAAYSTSRKWRAILKTLLTHSGTEEVPSRG